MLDKSLKEGYKKATKKKTISNPKAS